MFQRNSCNNFEILLYRQYNEDHTHKNTNHINYLEEIYAPCGKTTQEDRKGLNHLKVSGNSELCLETLFSFFFLILVT